MKLYDELKEQVSSNNWPMAVGTLLQIAVTASREAGAPTNDRFIEGAEAMRGLAVESVRQAYRTVERGEPASRVVGNLLEGLKRFQVAELNIRETENEAERPTE